MQCRVCKCKIAKNDEVKVKGGYICSSCYNSFPDSIKMYITDFTVGQLTKLSKIIYPATSKMLIRSGDLKICRNSISIKNTEFMLKDLRSLKLNFHPSGTGRHPNTVYGTITVVIETKSPHFLIEEPFFDHEITVGYGINGKVIYYYYSYEIEKLFEVMEKCLKDGSQDATPYLDEYQMAIMKEDELKKKKEEAQQKKKEEEKQKAEEKRRRQEEKRREEKKQRENTQNKDTRHKMSPFEEAKALFGVELPYTKEQLKSARNTLLKKYHPDNKGGSVEMCKKINESYALLKKFET